MSRAGGFEDAVAGCLMGGAVGDALGAVVEFDGIEAIRRRHGPAGVTGFPAGGGRITDDTQMTLFTAEGLIRARRRSGAGRFDYAPDELWAAYRRWLATQGHDAPGPAEPPVPPEPDGGLAGEPLLRHRRAPGNTCLSALHGGVAGFVDLPVNDSKGCGGVMRVAPVGLVAARPAGLGVASAALTHGHPSGYLASGATAVMIGRLVAGAPLRRAAGDALEAVGSWAGHEETAVALAGALDLADAEPVATPETVAVLGEGWVAEEAMAIALYCALTAATFPAGVLAAVNHSGDSDSTGAVTGNLLGAAGGLAAVPPEWVAGLAEREVVERVAAALFETFGGSD